MKTRQYVLKNMTNATNDNFFVLGHCHLVAKSFLQRPADSYIMSFKIYIWPQEEEEEELDNLDLFTTPSESWKQIYFSFRWGGLDCEWLPDAQNSLWASQGQHYPHRRRIFLMRFHRKRKIVFPNNKNLLSFFTYIYLYILN